MFESNLLFNSKGVMKIVPIYFSPCHSTVIYSSLITAMLNLYKLVHVRLSISVYIFTVSYARIERLLVDRQKGNHFLT